MLSLGFKMPSYCLHECPVMIEVPLQVEDPNSLRRADIHLQLCAVARRGYVTLPAKQPQLRADCCLKCGELCCPAQICK